MATFTSAFGAGDACYIFDNQGKGQLTSVAKLDFRVGTNFAAFNPTTDFIYTFVYTDPVSGDPVQRAEGFTFATKAAMKTYIDTLP